MCWENGEDHGSKELGHQFIIVETGAGYKEVHQVVSRLRIIFKFFNNQSFFKVFCGGKELHNCEFLPSARPESSS